MADVEECLQEVYLRLQEIDIRLEAIDDYLYSVSNQKAPKKKKPYVGHKTKYGLFIETAQKSWLLKFLNKSTLTLYKETMHHAKCCLCGKADISLTAKTFRNSGKDYIVPLCEECTHEFENTPNPDNNRKKYEPKYKLPRARILYNAVETKRRKF